MVGATHPKELATIRHSLHEAFFLLPGYGAQGGKPSDTAPAFREDGLGAVVSNSRGILYAFSPDERDWENKIEAATRKMIGELNSATGGRQR